MLLRDEGVHRRDLFVMRPPRMPAILVESAYLILPAQEQMLLDPAFQDQLAHALREGLREAFAHARRPVPGRAP